MSQRQESRRMGMPALGLALLLGTALLAACQMPPLLSLPRPSPPLTLIQFVPELQFVQPAVPLPDGPVGLRGFYGRYGPEDKWLDSCRLGLPALRCGRYAMMLDAQPGLLVEVTGQAREGLVAVEGWQPVAWDEEASRQAARQALADATTPLAGYPWQGLALANFAEATAGFQWPAGEIAGTPLRLYGYDMARNQVIWRAQGPNLPQQNPLVTRFPVVYLLAGPVGEGPVQVVATIEGFVEE